jgi:hypothetical protein
MANDSIRGTSAAETAARAEAARAAAASGSGTPPPWRKRQPS